MPDWISDGSNTITIYAPDELWEGLEQHRQLSRHLWEGAWTDIRKVTSHTGEVMYAGSLVVLWQEHHAFWEAHPLEVLRKVEAKAREIAPPDWDGLSAG